MSKLNNSYHKQHFYGPVSSYILTLIYKVPLTANHKYFRDYGSRRSRLFVMSAHDRRQTHGKDGTREGEMIMKSMFGRSLL